RHAALSQSTSSVAAVYDRRLCWASDLPLLIRPLHFARVEIVVPLDDANLREVLTQSRILADLGRDLGVVFMNRVHEPVAFLFLACHNSRLDRAHQRIDVPWSGIAGECGRDRTAALVPEHDNETRSEMINGVLDAAERV